MSHTCGSHNSDYQHGPQHGGRPASTRECDQGRGLPPEFDASKSKSLGMKLIASLGRQLGGRPEWQNANPDTRFVLDFFPQPHTA